MRKTWLAIGMAVLLAIPAGVAFAADDVTDDAVTTVAPVQDRDRVQLQDPACETCDARMYGDDAGYGYRASSSDQDQNRLRLHDPAECEYDGAQMRENANTQAKLENRVGAQGPNGPGVGRDGLGEGVGGGGFGEGPLDGSGPIHTGPGDGTGNQFGPAGR